MKATDYRPFRIRKSKDDKYYVVIVARNNCVLFVSETYTKKHSAKKAITACVFLCEQIYNNMSLQYGDFFIDETK